VSEANRPATGGRRARTVAFTFEPLPFPRALADSRLPQEAGPSGRFEIEVTPDEP
jgi:hypothetical protein